MTFNVLNIAKVHVLTTAALLMSSHVLRGTLPFLPPPASMKVATSILKSRMPLRAQNYVPNTGCCESRSFSSGAADGCGLKKSTSIGYVSSITDAKAVNSLLLLLEDLGTSDG